MRRLGLSIGCSLLCMNVFAQMDFPKLGFDAACEKAKAEGKFVFVKCYASWCRSCMSHPRLLVANEDVRTYLHDRYVCVGLDIKEVEGKIFSERFAVKGHPAYMVLSTDGRLLYRKTGLPGFNWAFVREMERQVNESIAFYLERRYVAGERDADFVTRYAIALKKAGDTIRAREVATDFLNLLTDEERTSAACWPIYEDAELSPAGSGNMSYLLRRVPQFRQRVGVDKVNARLVTLFETRLEDILRGRNRNVSMAEVEEVEKLLDAYELPNVDWLRDYGTLAKAMLAGDTATALTACRKVFVGMSDEKLHDLYFYPLTTLKGKWTEEQKEELAKLTTELVAQVRDETLEKSLNDFVKEMLPNL